MTGLSCARLPGTNGTGQLCLMVWWVHGTHRRDEGMQTRGFVFAACSCVDVYNDEGRLIGSLMADMATVDQRWFAVVHNWWGVESSRHVDCRIAEDRYRRTHQYRVDATFDPLGVEPYDNPTQALREIQETEQLHKMGGRHARIVER